MNITLNADLFQTEAFQMSFREKLKSARYYDYNPPSLPKQVPIKHYDYTRAAKGALAEAALMGYMIIKGTDFVYNRKVDKRKYSPDIDFYVPSINARIDVKSGFSFWKKEMLLKYGIDYVVVCSPFLHAQLDGVYNQGGWTLVGSYRQLFKNDIIVKLSGFISTEDVLAQGPTYELKSIEELF